MNTKTLAGHATRVRSFAQVDDRNALWTWTETPEAARALAEFHRRYPRAAR